MATWKFRKASALGLTRSTYDFSKLPASLSALATASVTWPWLKFTCSWKAHVPPPAVMLPSKESHPGKVAEHKKGAFGRCLLSSPMKQVGHGNDEPYCRESVFHPQKCCVQKKIVRYCTVGAWNRYVKRVTSRSPPYMSGPHHADGSRYAPSMAFIHRSPLLNRPYTHLTPSCTTFLTTGLAYRMSHDDLHLLAWSKHLHLLA